MWSVSSGGLQPLQNFTLDETIWFLYTNENTTITHGGNCTTDNGISGSFQSGTVVRNLLYPFDNYTLGASDKPFFFDGKAPFFGCIESITLQPYNFKVLVPTANWITPSPPLPNLLLGMTPESKWPMTIRTPTAATSRLSSRISWIAMALPSRSHSISPRLEKAPLPLVSAQARIRPRGIHLTRA